MPGDRSAHPADSRVIPLPPTLDVEIAPVSGPLVSSKRARPQPVRDAILAFMTEPRQAFEIARHTGKATASITGHMRAMLELGLVERIAYGRYARSGTATVPPRHIALIRPRSLTDRVLATLDQPKTLGEVAESLQLPVERVLPHLEKMRESGAIACNPNGILARISGGDDWQKRSDVYSARRDY